jgi:hypothetical protein
MVNDQLKEIETLQRAIVLQQSKADENLEKLQKQSAIVLAKINELCFSLGFYVSPELEQAVKEVSLRAASIDEKVQDTPPEC